MMNSGAVSEPKKPSTRGLAQKFGDEPRRHRLPVVVLTLEQARPVAPGRFELVAGVGQVAPPRRPAVEAVGMAAGHGEHGRDGSLDAEAHGP